MKQPKQKLRLSLCMIVKDEEQHLARCLRSARPVVDEIVIVDTGSSDGTIRLAEDFGALISQQPWQDDFAQARNASLERATGDWVLVLDADEELPGQTQARLRTLLARARCDAFHLCVRSLMSAGELQKYEDLPLTRLFRNRPQYRYEQPIHEQIRPVIERNGGRLRESGLVVLHYGYMQDIVQGGDYRAKRNLRLLQNAALAAPHDPYLLFQLGATYQALGKHDLAYASLRQVLDHDTQSLTAVTLDKLYMKLAQLALAGNRYAEAAGYAEESLVGNPRNVISLYVSALAYTYLGQAERAYQQFQRIRRCPAADRTNVQELNAVLHHLHDAMARTGRAQMAVRPDG